MPQLSTSKFLTTKAPLHSWEWPSQPWSRLHLDFAGPFTVWDRCFYLWWILTQSGWMSKSCSRSQQRKPLRSYNHFSLPTDCQSKSLLTTVHHLPARNLNNLSPGIASNTHSLLYTIPPQMDWQRGQSEHSNKGSEKCHKAQ